MSAWSLFAISMKGGEQRYRGCHDRSVTYVDDGLWVIFQHPRHGDRNDVEIQVEGVEEENGQTACQKNNRRPPVIAPDKHQTDNNSSNTDPDEHRIQAICGIHEIKNGGIRPAAGRQILRV